MYVELATLISIQPRLGSIFVTFLREYTGTKNNNSVFQTYFTKSLDDPQGMFGVNGVYDFHLNEDIFKDANNSYSLVCGSSMPQYIPHLENKYLGSSM